MSNKQESSVSRFFSGLCLYSRKKQDSQYEMLKSDEGNKAEDNIPLVVTIDDILDEIGLTLFHVKLFFFLGCLLFLDSFGISMLSVISPVVKSEWNLSIWEVAMVPLVTTCGMAVGSSIVGRISDQFGRKRAIIGSSVWIFCFGLSSFLALNYYLLLVILFIIGLGMTMPAQVVTNIEEFFPRQHRTKFALLSSLFWTLGFFMSAIVGAYIDYLGFRVALALVCIPTAIVIMGTPFIPESPRFCLESGDNEKALLILQQIASEKMSAKFHSWKIYKNVDIPMTRGSVVELFRHGYGKITCCLWLVWFFSMFCYYFIVFSATELATKKVFLKSNQTELSNNNYSTLAWMSLPEVFFMLFTVLTTHYVNNKTFLLAFASISVLLQVTLLFIGSNHKITELLALIVLSRGCMSCQVNVLLIYTSEIYPTLIRGIGLGISLSMGRTGMIAGPFIAQTLFQKTYFLGTLVNVCCLAITLVGIILLPFRGKNQMLQ